MLFTGREVRIGKNCARGLESHQRVNKCTIKYIGQEYFYTVFLLES